VSHLEEVLASGTRSTGTRRAGVLVLVEGVYSMDGDVAPLREIREACDRHGARLLVDEAHATGVLGENGRGSIEHCGVDGKMDLVVGTFSKTLAATGGFVASSAEVINYVRFYARSYFFSASISPVIVACAAKALELIGREGDRRKRLWENIVYLRNRLVQLGFNVGNSNSAIIPIIVGDDGMLRKIGYEIHEKGVFANTVFFPAVPHNSSRIRLSVMATHTKEDLDTVVNAMKEIGEKHGLI
jgi:glycine C-acetyltransferase